MKLNFSFKRFVEAQNAVYPDVIVELSRGQKRTCWMWYIFPQLAGLGTSSMANCYALRSLDEARQYAAHPLLGKRLRECTELVASLNGRRIQEIFGNPDYLKFRSCMTLFAIAIPTEPIFAAALDKYFGGVKDQSTIGLLGEQV